MGVHEKTTFTLHDVNTDLILCADSYLRTVIINQKRRYKRKITKFSRHGISFLELEKYESNLVYNDTHFNSLETTYFYVKGKRIPIKIPELAEALGKLSELHLQLLLQAEILGVRLEDVAKEFGISRSMIYVHRQKAIDELKRTLKDYEK